MSKKRTTPLSGTSVHIPINGNCISGLQEKSGEKKEEKALKDSSYCAFSSLTPQQRYAIRVDTMKI